jgi:hypothetical protein
MGSSQLFGGICGSGQIIQGHAKRTEQICRSVTPQSGLLGAGGKFCGVRFVENIDWESLLSVVRQGIASRRRRVAPALLLC